MAYNDGIFLWEYEKDSNEYKSNQMIAYAQSGRHSRGGMNEEGIYVAAISGSVRIYDMKYYNNPDHKIKLLNTFSHYSTAVNECFFKNPVSAMCCEYVGYIKEYDLNNPHSMPTSTIFNKTTDLSGLISCMGTKDKKYIIAGGQQKLHILDAEDGTLRHNLDYSANVPYCAQQIAEVRPIF